MNQNTFCTYLGHCQFQCIMNRGCCSLCIRNSIHGHQMWSQNHIITFETLLARAIQEVDQQNDSFQIQYLKELKNFLEQIFMECKILEKLIIVFRQNFEGQMTNLGYKDEYQLQARLTQEDQIVFQSDDKIKELFNNGQFNQNIKLQLQQLDRIQQQLTIILQKSKEFEENMNEKNGDKNDKNKVMKSKKYTTQKINVSNQLVVDSSIISNNNQYLVYNNLHIIHMYDIKLNKFSKSIGQQNRISAFQFTQNAKLLFAGDYKGFVLGFLFNGLKLFYKQRIHQDTITQIIIQKQYLITSSWDETFIKTDFVNKQQIFKIYGNSDQIYSIDYDETKNVMISAQDQQIKIWDCTKQSLIIDSVILLEENQYIYQVQLDDKQNLISLDNKSNLIRWKIDYQNKQLLKLAQYNDSNRIFGFQQVYKDQSILLIFDQYCEILDSEGQIINIIKHNIKLSCNFIIKISKLYFDQLQKTLRQSKLYHSIRLMSNLPPANFTMKYLRRLYFIQISQMVSKKCSHLLITFLEINMNRFFLLYLFDL